MNRIRLAGILGAGAVAMIALSSCNSEPAGPPPGAPPLVGNLQACPRIYRPVCAARSGARRTFPNACEASTAGYDIRYDGQCSRGGQQPGDGFTGPSDTFGGNPAQSRPGGFSGTPGNAACARIYKPVCGKLNGESRTFPNSCVATNAGYQVAYNSECVDNDTAGSAGRSRPEDRGGSDNGDDSSVINVGPADNGPSGNSAPGGGASGNGPSDGGSSGSSPSPGQQAAASDSAASAQTSCSRSFVPVCGAQNGKKQTFINACTAKARGFSIASQGRCQ